MTRSQAQRLIDRFHAGTLSASERAKMQDDVMIFILQAALRARRGILQLGFDDEPPLQHFELGEGKLDTLTATITGRFDSLADSVNRSQKETRDSRLTVIVTIIGSALSLGVLIVAMWTYGDALFSRGIDR